MEPDQAMTARGPGAHRAIWASSLEATRLSLLTRLKKPNDDDGWQRFFDTYAGVIHALAVRSGLNGAEADDALQETMLSVAREMPGFNYDRAKGSFKGWLFLIARRRIADQFRRRARHQRDGDDAADTIERAPDLAVDPLNQLWEEEWRQNQLQLAIDRVKQRVAPRQWQMFDLVALQAWPAKRICDVLGVNRASIYMAKMRVGRMLKAELESVGQDGPLA
jgi:RNA polymerase sigma-70 factor (ECF subfamily)